MTAALVSLDEYLHTNHDPAVEYVDGVLVGRKVGTQLHSLLEMKTPAATAFRTLWWCSNRLQVAPLLFPATNLLAEPDCE